MEPNSITARCDDQIPPERRRATLPPPIETLAAFGLADEEPTPLPGGEQRTYKVDHAVLKHLGDDSAAVVTWTANLHASIREDGFRVAKPLPVRGGGWITDDGWSASALLDGQHDYRGRIEECVAAITRYHAALREHPRPDFLDAVDTPYTKADRHAFGDKPSRVHPMLAHQVDLLYAVRQPLVGLPDQLIHGDLNPGNILLSAGQPPAIIDIAPYWRPAPFALAVFAYWIGPWLGQPERLAHFVHVEQFDQLLIRAGIRMLISMSEFGRIEDLERYTRATELIVAGHGV